MPKFTHSSFILPFTFVLAFGLDQVSKYWALNNLSDPWQILPFLTFRLTYNYQIAWSLPLPTVLILPMTLLILTGVLLFYFWKSPKTISARLLFGALLAGAAGNLLDRMIHGAVVDFISIANFPIFNLADCFITVSVFLLVLFYDKIMGINKAQN